MSMTRFTRLTVAAGIVAAISSVAGAAFSEIIPVATTNESNMIRISMSDYFGLGSEPTTSGTYPTEITWRIRVDNSEGFDIGQVAFRMDQFPGENYGNGDVEFDSIVFVDPNNLPAGFVGPAALDVLDPPTAGDTDQPFTVNSLLFSDDTGFLAENQRLDIVFSDLAPHALGDELEYMFTIYNPNQNLYDFSVEFFPVPAPGATAIAGLALLGLTKRRR